MCWIYVFTLSRSGIREHYPWLHCEVLKKRHHHWVCFRNVSLKINLCLHFICRLCEDLIGKNLDMFVKHLIQLPPQLRDKMEKRAAFFSSSLSILPAPALTTD